MQLSRMLALGVGSLGIVIAAQAGCSEDTKVASTDAGADRANEGPIVIGTCAPMTGGRAARGAMIQNVVAIVEQIVNASGGVLGRNIKFKIVDDASDNAKVVEVVNGFLQEKVPVIFGPTTSGQVLSVHQAVAAQKVLHLSGTATSPALTTAQPANDRYFYRTVPPDDFQGKAIAKFIHSGVPSTADGGTVGGNCRKLATINGDDGYGNALISVVKQTFAGLAGTSVVSEDKVPTQLQADYKSVAAKVVAAKPDCLVLAVYSDVAAQLMQDLKPAIKADVSGHDWSKFFVTGVDGMYDAAFIQKSLSNPADPTSANAAESVFGTVADPAPDTAQYSAYRNLWKGRYPDQEPAAYGATTFDAMMLIALAIQAAGTATDGTAIRDALLKVARPPGTAYGPAGFGDALGALKDNIDIDYSGASGFVDFDEFGNVRADYIVWHVEKKTDGTYGLTTVGRIKSTDL